MRKAVAGLGMRLVQGAAMWRACVSRPMLLGVRAIVVDPSDRVFLVRHSYVEGWHLPGGGVERGETVLQSLARELEEEGNIVLEGLPELHGIFFNRKFGNRDHVAVYVVRQFRQTGPRGADYEIVETGFFPIGNLPETIAPASRARLAEIFEAAPVSPEW